MHDSIAKDFNEFASNTNDFNEFAGQKAKQRVTHH